MTRKILGPEEVHLEKRGKPIGLHLRFSQKRNELLDATDLDIVSAFTYDTTYEALIHEPGKNKNSDELT